MGPSSFGLSPDYKQKVLLEELFFITRYLKNISWTEAWDLPIEYRKWLLDREKKQRQKEKEEMEKAAKKKK